MGSVGRCSIFVPALDIGHLSTRRSTASLRGGTGGAWVHPNAPANPRPREGRRQGRNTYRGHLSQPDRHGYFDIDLEIVWDTLNDSLPDLETKVGHIRALASAEGEERARGET